jgi:SNF2 family DNA or RNA helicase
VLKHHGPSRTKDPSVFKDYDVVVTTYQVVASDMPTPEDKKQRKKKKIPLDDFMNEEEEEYNSSSSSSNIKQAFPEKYTPLKKDHGPLFQVNWHRIVLDEAQFIKNRNTKASISCATLTSSKRWCLTGTPIQNNVDELYSLLRFLRIQPLSEYITFKKNISIPIMNGDTRIAMSRLKAVLMAVMLRRTKAVLGSDKLETVEEPKPNDDDSNTPLSKKLALKLPIREKTDVLLQFSQHEQGLYRMLMSKTQDSIQSMVGNQSRYMNMLCMLLRLRQGK